MTPNLSEEKATLFHKDWPRDDGRCIEDVASNTSLVSTLVLLLCLHSQS